MKTRIILLLSVLASALNAQDDVFALSPFEVDSGHDKGYYASSSLSGSRLQTNLYSSYQAPVVLRRKADSVTLSVFLKNNSRKALDRNEQMMETVAKIIERAEASDGIRAHNGEISLSTRNKKVSIFSTSMESSQVRIFILGDLAEGEDVFTKTQQIKQFLENIEVVGETVLEEGSIGLSIKNPQSYRKEILGLILDDINGIKAGLGDAVDMNITGLDRQVVVKQANESEVDLLIPYNFTLRHHTESDDDDD